MTSNTSSTSSPLSHPPATQPSNKKPSSNCPPLTSQTTPPPPNVKVPPSPTGPTITPRPAHHRKPVYAMNLPNPLFSPRFWSATSKSVTGAETSRRKSATGLRTRAPISKINSQECTGRRRITSTTARRLPR